MMHLNMCV